MEQLFKCFVQKNELMLCTKIEGSKSTYMVQFVVCQLGGVKWYKPQFYFKWNLRVFGKIIFCKHKCFNDVQHRILLHNFLTAEIRLKIWTRNFLVRARVIPMRGSNLDRCNEGNFFSSISLLSEMSFVYTDLSKLSFKTPLFKLFAALSKKNIFMHFSTFPEHQRWDTKQRNCVAFT